VTREQIIQECIDAITAEGVRVREGSNESWRQGMFYAAEILRKMKSEKEIGATMTISSETFAQWQEWSKRDDWHQRFVGSDIRQMLGEIERSRTALKFCGDMAEEELPHAKVGTGAEVVLRHIVRRVSETI
jgi:hypothetical protein